MPFPIVPIIGALGAIGSSVASGMLNKSAAESTNKMQIDYAREAYARERKDALADWQMQNDYNSPAATMQRLRQAGLSPNLMYGSAANMPASKMASPSMQSINPSTPRYDVQDPIAAYLNTEVQQAQIDNMKTQNAVLTAEKALKLLQGESLKFDTDFRRETKGLAVESLDAALRKTRADIDAVTHGNQRAQELQKGTLQEQAQKVALLGVQTRAAQQGIQLTASQIDEAKERIKNAQKQGLLLDLERQLKQKDVDFYGVGRAAGIVGTILNTILGRFGR